MPDKKAPARAWQRMLSGRRLDLLDPSPLDIEIEDIAHGLARVARWNGQTHGAFALSVAQHCVMTEEIAGVLYADLSEQDRLAALLHDAAEYVIGDMISPFKAVLGGDYKSVENRIQGAVHIRFGLKPVTQSRLAARIKQSDRVAAYFEAIRLAGFSPDEAKRFFGAPPKIYAGPDAFAALAPLSADTAEQAFLNRFAALKGD